MSGSIPDDNILVENARLAVKLDLHEKRALGLPIARYDPKTKTVYLENADGSITPMGQVPDRLGDSKRHDE